MSPAEIEKMQQTITELENRVEVLEEELSEARTTITNLLDSEEPYRALVDALKIYLSWQDAPPPGMDAAEVARLGRILRSQLHDALRAVS
jgi:hypothetical protein